MTSSVIGGWARVVPQSRPAYPAASLFSILTTIKRMPFWKSSFMFSKCSLKKEGSFTTKRHKVCTWFLQIKEMLPSSLWEPRRWPALRAEIFPSAKLINFYDLSGNRIPDIGIDFKIDFLSLSHTRLMKVAEVGERHNELRDGLLAHGTDPSMHRCSIISGQRHRSITMSSMRFPLGFRTLWERRRQNANSLETRWVSRDFHFFFTRRTRDVLFTIRVMGYGTRGLTT